MAPEPEEAQRPGDRRQEVTLALRAAAEGDEAQREKVFELVYGELRRLADRYLREERRDHTLQPTALVHEVYLDLLGSETDARDRQGFLALAATAMRRTLIDHARGKGRLKRGGGWERVEIDAEALPETGGPLDLLRLDEALEALRQHSESMSRLVELRFFAGLPMNAVADVLGVSERTAGRDWSFARAWLQRWMKDHER